MPDTKITALTALTAADPANDVLPIVDVSDTTMAASGTTKKISINNVLGCSGTATFSTLTVSGAATAQRFIPSSATVPSNGMYLPAANELGWAINSAEAMRLNSTGLGLGVTPTRQIDIRRDQAAFTTIALDNHNAIASGTGTQFLLIDGGTNAGWFRRNRDASGNTDIGYKDTLRFRGQIAGTERTDMTIDTSGNVISNVTGTAPTLGTNNQMVFNLTSNTNLRISVRGSDGTTRTANITLA